MNRRRQINPVPQPSAPVARRLSGWRLWRWRLLALVGVPLVVLVMFEMTLRLAGFGYPTAFLLSSSHHDRKTFVQNNQFGWRFFGKRRSRTPDAISMLQDKPANTIRIFVFGESAAFGDPQPAFGLPRVLQTTLSLRHPGMKFEMVNAAMTAINSHVILPIARDCARARGDIWVVYMGNNEVVGPFGAGTVFGSQSLPRPLIRASLALKTTRIGQFFDAARERWQKAPADQNEWGGMLMFLNQQVPVDDPRMANVYRNFERNLSDIIRAGRDSGAEVVVSTVAVNLKDCAPFASRHRAGLSEADKRKWDDLTRLGMQAQTAGKVSEAVAQFQAAAQVDDASAELQFRLGRSLLEVGDIAGAQKAFSAARDLDTLRFRCDSRLNELARQAAAGRQTEGIRLADAERSFAAASTDGLPGHDLFYEHVHLTFEGNCLLARILAEQIEQLLPQSASSGHPAWPTMADCARRLGRTERDLPPALSDILGRLTEAPFTSQINHDEQMEYLFQESRKAAANASLPSALNAAQAAVDAAPEDAQLCAQVAALERAADHPAEAEKAARRAVDLLPSSAEDWSQLGFTFVQQKKYDEAVGAYQRAFDLNPQDVFPLQNLALSLAKLGRNQESMREYKRALAITPRFGLAWLGLGQLLESMGRKAEAEDCYQKALQNRIHRAPELATLARFCMSHGWFQAASTNYGDAIKLDPSDRALAVEAGQADFLFGMQLGKAGQAAAAAREFQTAVRLMPEMVEARLNLGIALFREGQWNESLHEFEQVAARNPANALARHYLDILHGRPSAPEQK
jgi:tetratricopeptide (TPR) repeat protein